MQRYHFFFGVANEKLLLLCIIVSCLVVITSARKVKLHSDDFIWEKRKNDTADYKISNHEQQQQQQQPFQLNGLKSGIMISKILNKIIEIYIPTTTYESRRPPRTASFRNIEYFDIHTIAGDGRCMFRALVKGMAINRGVELGPHEEEVEADELRMEIKKVICDNDNEHGEFEDAIFAITLEESLNSYCERIMHFSFWGGEAELLILSKLLSLPIIVYKPQREYTYTVDPSAGFVEIANYKPEFKNGSTRGEPKNVVRLSFTSSHYDLLL